MNRSDVATDSPPAPRVWRAGASLVAADGAGNVQFTSDSSSSKGLQSNQVLSGTYSVDTHGRAVFTVSGDSTARIFYVVSPTRTVFLSGDGGGYLSNFEQ